jgi:hypothetical protein
MAAPTYSAGSLGNGINAVSLAHGTSIACLIDGTTILAWAATCQLLTGSSAITAAVNFSLYRAPGQTASAPQTTLSAGPSSGATSISVTSATGVGKNCILAIIPAAGGLGEIVTVSNVSGTTLTVAALTNGYSSGDYVFFIDQAATAAVAPGSSWAANTEYSQSIYSPSNMLYILGVKNTDGTNAATITVTIDKNPAFS